MASGIFAVLDDIASLMDDVSAASKIATQKTAGILGDDLAVNAEKATGFVSSREIPVLWAITKGSFLNKLIIIPIAIVLNLFFPAAIKVILTLGGFYLAYEGVEKMVEWIFHRNDHHTDETPESETAVSNPEAAEKAKVSAAIKTDFILSIEIVIIALGTALDKDIYIQILTVIIVGFLATVGVYGIVALIVRMDDAGFKLIRHSHDKGIIAKFGHLLVRLLPIIIRILGIVGTIALIMVSGGIFLHNIDILHHWLPEIPSLLREILLGLAGGIVAFALVWMAKKIFVLIKK
ncbi:DUF808 domain-containing protein [Daejeonia sp. YH14]|uniref:DUF808 domain-containing protein n=1 Tax=Daejeonia sp. YH14 TaxID=3439042 RepID=UPI003F493DD3